MVKSPQKKDELANLTNNEQTWYNKLNQLYSETQKLTIYSSFIYYKGLEMPEFKKYLKKSNALDNIDFMTLFKLGLKGYVIRKKDYKNIVTFESFNYLRSLMKNYNNERDWYNCLEIIERLKVKLETTMSKTDNSLNMKMVNEFLSKDKDEPVDIYEATKDKKNFIPKLIPFDGKSKIAKLRFLKYYACQLRFQKGWSPKQIRDKLNLTQNQLKNALSKYKDVKLNDLSTENRGVHKKIKTIRTKDNIDYLENLIKTADKPLTVREIKDKFENEKLGFKCSNAIVYRMIKFDLKMKYGLPKKVIANKNELNNKTYRYWVANKIVNALEYDDLIISIDETGFSDYIDKTNTWYEPKKFLYFKTYRKMQVASYSLLLASSKDEILGYYIVRGSVNSIIYLSFIMNLVKLVKSRYLKRNIILLMDNARIHKAAIMRQYMVDNPDIEFIFTPAYTPEINFIENIFQRIKTEFRKGMFEYDK